ncbi:MAG: hypothetical protein GWN62_33260 [Aliifodinibius sp.]|nr:hypothetical protein [Fodinibius sp.]
MSVSGVIYAIPGAGYIAIIEIRIRPEGSSTYTEIELARLGLFMSQARAGDAARRWYFGDFPPISQELAKAEQGCRPGLHQDEA